MDKLKTVVVGLGFGEELVRRAGPCEYFELAGGFARTPATRNAFAAKFGVKTYAGYDEILEDSSVQAVLIATPNDTHRDLAVRAAAAGKHVFLEKPIDNTIEAGRAIIEACENAGVTLFVGHLLRRVSVYRVAKRMIDAGDLGQVVLAETNFSHSGGLSVKEGDWRWYRDRCPGGPVIQLAAHDFDTLSYLVGPIKSVYAKIKRLATPAEIEDTAVISAEMESGALAYVGTAYTVPPVSFTNIYGTEGALLLHRRTNDVTLIHKDGKREAKAIPEPVNHLADELDHFARCALFGEKPETGGPEGLAALAAVLASIKSAQEDRSVMLSEILGE